MRLAKLVRLLRLAWPAMLLELAGLTGAAAESRPPNVVLILADDLGYGDLGCYGQQRIRTPRLDQLAADGLRFTQFYAGSTVCAPSRCALMTGKHCGHARIRGNAAQPLLPEDVTIAEVLRDAGYVTGIFGKWGLGEENSSGVPNRQGFDEWFGFLNQTHAHNYYPEFLYLNERRFPLENVAPGGVATTRAQYAPDLITERALDFIERQRKGPFFLYLAYTQPHANNEAGKQGMETPSDEPYSREDWPQSEKNFAAMVTGLDRDIGRVLDRIESLGLDDSTLIVFTSENGPHAEGGHDPEFFRSSGALRGFKRSLHDGGIRVPAIARWNGRIAAGAATAQIAANWDLLPTIAELAGRSPPHGVDGVSLAPTLLAQASAARSQIQPDYLYWEFHERGFAQAIRQGDWKAVRENLEEPLELYDLVNDESEREDVAARHPEVVSRLERLLAGARTDSPEWIPRRRP